MKKENEEEQNIKQTKESDEISLIEIPTQYGETVKLPDGTILQGNEILVWLCNQVWRIKKSVA